MNTFDKLEKYLKSREHFGQKLPEIRYFDGTNSFSTSSGQYKSETLEGALSLFLEDIIFK